MGYKTPNVDRVAREAMMFTDYYAEQSCTACTGAEKDQPIVGLVIIKDLSLKGDRYKDGTLLDPDDGKIYKGEVWVEGGKLKVRGYLAFFFRTQTWVRGK